MSGGFGAKVYNKKTRADRAATTHGGVLRWIVVVVVVVVGAFVNATLRAIDQRSPSCC